MVQQKATNFLPPVSEWVLSSHELIQRHTQSEVVDTEVIFFSFQHLRGHVPCKNQSERLVKKRKKKFQSNGQQ